MRPTPTSPLSLLLLLAPALASAQDFVVTGPDVAGTATVTQVAANDDGSQEVDVSVRYRRFGPTPAEAEFRGEGVLTADGLTWTHPNEVEVPRRGVIDWIRDPYITPQPPRRYTVHTKVIMRRTEAGDLTGVIHGVEQTWTVAPASRTDDLVVLMVPGLSTNYWNRVGLPYFDENRDAMRALGLEVRRIGTRPDGAVDAAAEFKTENSVAKNAALIAEEIRAEAARGKRVIVFAHSKGGTDATAAIAADPSLVEHVAGMVAIQPVYGGSPVADFAGHSWLTTTGVQLAFELWAGGSRDAVLDLTTKRRAAFVEANPYPADRIPTVVIRSTFDRDKLRVGKTARGEPMTNVGKRFFQRVLRTNQGLIQTVKGEASDGMVTKAAQTIPGATHIDKDDLDHFEPGLEMISPHAPANLTTEAVLALLRKLEARGAR